MTPKLVYTTALSVFLFHVLLSSCVFAGFDTVTPIYTSSNLKIDLRSMNTNEYNCTSKNDIFLNGTKIYSVTEPGSSNVVNIHNTFDKGNYLVVLMEQFNCPAFRIESGPPFFIRINKNGEVKRSNPISEVYGEPNKLIDNSDNITLIYELNSGHIYATYNIKSNKIKIDTVINKKLLCNNLYNEIYKKTISDFNLQDCNNLSFPGYLAIYANNLLKNKVTRNKYIKLCIDSVKYNTVYEYNTFYKKVCK